MVNRQVISICLQNRKNCTDDIVSLLVSDNVDRRPRIDFSLLKRLLILLRHFSRVTIPCPRSVENGGILIMENIIFAILLGATLFFPKTAKNYCFLP